MVPWSGPLLDTQSWTSTAAASGTTSQHTTSCHTIPIPTLQLSAHASSPRSITHLLHDTPHNATPQHTTLHHVIPCYSTPCHVTPSHATCVRLTDNCLLPTTYDPIPTAIRPATLPPFCSHSTQNGLKLTAQTHTRFALEIHPAQRA